MAPKPLYVIPVPHSGSTSLRAMLTSRNLPHRWTHCEKIYEIAIPRIRDEYQIVTTLRDPYKVAASWANRQPGGFRTPRNIRRWFANWKRWSMLSLPPANVITMEELDRHENADHQDDPSGARKALLAEDWDRYFSIVPKECVDYANLQIVIWDKNARSS